MSQSAPSGEGPRRAPVFAAFAVSRTGNRGAVSMLESAIDYLTARERGGRVNVFTVYPRADRALPPAPGVALHSGTPWNLVFKLIPLCLLYRLLKVLRLRPGPGALGREMKALLESDVCLMIGGTTFTDAQPVKLPWNLACLLPAIILGKPSMMYSQTLGPFRMALNRLCARWALGRMSCVVPRGAGSAANVASLGLATRVEPLPDSAFSLSVPEETAARVRGLRALMAEGRKVVGISVNSIVERKCGRLGIEHNAVWARFMSHLTGAGYQVLLVPHSMRPKGRTRHNNDLLTVRDILSRMPDQRHILVVDEPYDCKELRAVVGLADYYVASRFHSMISAICNRVPVLVFGWGFQKYAEVMSDFGIEAYCHDAKELSFEALVSGFERIVRDADSIRARMAEHMPRVRRGSERNHEIALELAGR